MSVGGFSGPNSITFIGKKFKVKAILRKDGSCHLVHSKLPSVQFKATWMYRIPFVRGLRNIFDMAIMSLMDGWLGAFLVVFIVDSQLSLYKMQKNPPVAQSASDDYIFYGLFLAVFLVIRFFSNTFQFHAAEHMAINTYEADKDLSEENIQTASRVHAHCGTNLVLLFLIISYLLGLTGSWIDAWPFVNLLLVYAFSLEVFYLEFKPLTWFGSKLQYYVTTRQPDNRHIKVAKLGLTRLITLEKGDLEKG